MSASTPRDPNAANALSTSANAGQEGSPHQLTARQMLLHWRWSFYACRTYEGRKHDWDGRKAVNHVEHETIAMANAIPPGFVDVSGAASELPIKFRKPTAPYYLVRSVVNRFTGMLFSARRCPKVRCPDDQQTEDWLNGFVTDSQLWTRMSLARQKGGSMGSVGIGYRFARGKPVIEIHDPRWATPVYQDRDTGELRQLEIKYTYQDETRDAVTGQTIRSWFWFRRVIDRSTDRTWRKVPAEQTGNIEPDWKKHEPEEKTHGYGFCPIVWIQNSLCDEGVDGWCDAEGVFESQMAIDVLTAQAHKGTVANADPTPVLTSDAEEDGTGSLKKGSANGVQVEKGGDLKYLEMTGSGGKAALELASEYRKRALEVARCVLDANFDGPARTETETEANYSAMIEAADDLRGQYGQGIKTLLEMVLESARAMSGKIRAVRDGARTRVVRETIRLTPQVVEHTLADGTRTKIRKTRVLGEGEIIELHWPDYRPHNLDDLGKVVDATTKAVQASVIDRETAGRQVAPYFHVEDVPAMMARAHTEQKQQVEQMNDQMAERGQQIHEDREAG
jgi:hypothetical protein